MFRFIYFSFVAIVMLVFVRCFPIFNESEAVSAVAEITEDINSESDEKSEEVSVVSIVFNDFDTTDDILSEILLFRDLKDINLRLSFNHSFNKNVPYSFIADDDLRPVTLYEFAELIGPYCSNLKSINKVEYITDLFSENEYYNTVLPLYETGVYTGNEYGAFLGENYITVSTARQIITALNKQNLRKEYSPEPNNDNALLDVKCIHQNPQLPTGCEVTSLATVLNYMGIAVDKCHLANEYLEIGEIGVTHPNDAFVGSPYSSGSFGCFSPVIVNCANSYFNKNIIDYTAYDISGSSIDRLFLELEQGFPVLVWATMSLTETEWIFRWSIDGEDVYFPLNEHCMVLVGYDNAKNCVYVADPLKGNVEYDMDLFESRYMSLRKQAVIIK